MAAAPAAKLKIRLYGPFEASLDGSPLIGLRNREGERLIALLAINHGRVVPNASIAATLWPDTGSLDSLRQTVVHVRHVLGEEAGRLQAPKGGLMLDLCGADVDVVSADAGADAGDEASLRRSVSLYRGPFLSGWEERYPADRHWVVREREARKEKYRDALRALARTYLTGLDHEVAAGYLQLYVAANPIDEWGWIQWMLTLTSAGQRPAAINLYLKCRDYFQNRYNLSPPQEMTRLYQQLRKDQAACDQPDEAYEIEPVGGAVPLRSPYYIARSADRAFQAALARRDSIVLVKGPRQTGKTSLLARGLQQARESGAQVVFVDLQKLSPDHWVGMAQFYKALAQHLADQLDLELSLEDTWSDRRGVNENFERYLRREVLQKLGVSLVWGLDEVDRLFGYPYANDVFALFRSWHNERSLHPDGPWTRLTLAISYASEAHLFITDLNQSPFNVGTRLTLEDFTPAQVAELNHLYGTPLGGDQELSRFYGLFGGNPYLVRRALQALATRESDLASLEAHAQGADGPFGAHLQRTWLALSQSADLVEAVRVLLHGQSALTPESFFRLRSAGLVVGSEPSAATLRCRLYAGYLEARLR